MKKRLGLTIKTGSAFAAALVLALSLGATACFADDGGTDGGADEPGDNPPAEEPVTGWVETDGIVSYIGDDGIALTGFQCLVPRDSESTDAKWFYFAEDGSLVTSSWVQDNGIYYYMQESGEMLAGDWVQCNDHWYYLKAGTGAMASACWGQINGHWYYFGENGRMATGWRNISGSWYYFGSTSGIMAAGAWGNLDGAWYYFKDNGKMATGWYKVASSWYYFLASGKMAHDTWSHLDGDWYYLKSSGAMATGWLKSDGSWYYLNKTSGKMAHSAWGHIDGKWYYFEASGKMTTGWKTISGNAYYFFSNGAMATGTVKINGVQYQFGSDGAIGAEQRYMINKAQGYSSSTNWLILVDTTDNYIAIFYGSKGNWQLDKFWRCSTGAANSPTVIGEYTVGAKGYSFGHGYTCYYYTQFYGDYLIHSVTYYEGTRTVMEGKMGVNISAGCVRLLIENAKWVYDNIPSGTKVVTFE